jgi:hypothetical protein
LDKQLCQAVSLVVAVEVVFEGNLNGETDRIMDHHTVKKMSKDYAVENMCDCARRYLGMGVIVVYIVHLGTLTYMMQRKNHVAQFFYQNSGKKIILYKFYND